MFARLRHAVVMSSFMVATACASSPQSTESASPRSSRNLIAAPELMATNAASAYEAIQRLRPSWLRPRSGTGSEGFLPVVYIDGVRSGDLYFLQSIRIEDVDRIRYLNSRDATTRWGTGHAGGAIEVIRKTGGG